MSDKWPDGDDIWNIGDDGNDGLPDSTTDGSIAPGLATIGAAVGPATLDSIEIGAPRSFGAPPSIEDGGSDPTTTDKWIGGDDLWNTAGAWSDGLPNSTTDVLITSGGLPLIDASVGAVTVNSVDDNWGLSIKDGGSLTTVAGITVSHATLWIDEGGDAVDGSLTVGGDLINSGGTIDVDAGFDAGGGSLTVEGTLTNTGALEIGEVDVQASATVTLGALYGEGSIDMTGNSSSAIQERLEVGSAAPSTLNSTIDLNDDALLQYGSGAITAIGAKGRLVLDGIAATQVNVVGDGGNNSALKLTSNAGYFSLDYGPSWNAGAGVNVTNSGMLGIDDLNLPGGQHLIDPPSSSLTIGGDLDNSGTIDVDTGWNTGLGSLTVDGTLTNSGVLEIGNAFLLKASTVTLGEYVDGGGAIVVIGKETLALGPTEAPSTLNSRIDIYGNGVLQYGGGAITAIGASGQLVLYGQVPQVTVSGSAGNDNAQS